MALRLGCLIFSVVLAALVGGCSTSSAHLTDISSTATRVPVHGPRAELIRAARQQLGAPYRYGGADPDGFDCSGLVYFVYREIGIETPRTVVALRKAAKPVALRALRTGDLLFFSMYGGKGRHVAIYEGNGVFIHAPSNGKLVARANLSNPYWRAHLVSAGSYF